MAKAGSVAGKFARTAKALASQFAFRVKGRSDATGDRPSRLDAQPSAIVGTPDALREPFWQGFRHLFPPHAVVAQTDSGALVVSWSMEGDAHARFPYSAPIVIRFEHPLIEAMRLSDDPQRHAIVSTQERSLRQAMVGYDPYDGVRSRVVVLG